MASNWSSTTTGPISQIKASKLNSYNIKLDGESWWWTCYVTGIAITKDNNRILVDNTYNKVKLFSPHMKFLCSVSVPEKPWGITVVKDDKVFVSIDARKMLVVLNTACRSVIEELKLEFSVRGMATYKDKLVVTCPFTNPPCVKLIDMTGKVCWSATTYQQGERLFKEPWYLCCHDDQGKSTVLVPDRDKSNLMVLKAETGEVDIRRQLIGNWGRRGVTTDTTGNVFICSRADDQVTVLSGGLVEERILLNKRDGLAGSPCVIVYDKTRNQLIIAYWFSNIIDCFKLS